MKKFVGSWIIVLSILLLITDAFAADPVHFVGVHTGPGSIKFTGNNSTIGEDMIQPQDEVGVYDGNILCGSCVVSQAGGYSVFVYPDDTSTAEVVDGATVGHVLTFVVWDQSAGKEITVHSDGFTALDIKPIPTITIPASPYTPPQFTSGLNDSWGLNFNAVLNVAPTADAGDDQAVDEGTANVALDGSGSDSDGNVVSQAWTQTAGPDVTLSDASAFNPTFTAPDVTQDTTLTFELTVTDDGGATGTDTVDVTVNWINVGPTANAGTDQPVNEGTANVALDGSGSSDPDDGIATYAWVQTSGTTVTFSDASIVNPTFTAPDVNVAGATLTFELTVTDGSGATDADTVDVTVNWVNEGPTANAGPDQTVAEGSNVALNGSGSSDPDDGIASYAWVKTAGPAVTLSDATAANPTFTAPDVDQDAILTFELTVTDNSGVSDTATVNVNVSWGNVAPTANAGSDQTVDEGTANVALDGSGSSDPDDGIASYAWVQTSGTTVTLSDASIVNPTFTAPDVNVAGATLTFELTVTDNGGLTGTDTVNVTVAWVNVGPTANAGTDQAKNEADTVTLDGSGSSDPDDGIASYAWLQTGGTTVTLSDASAEKPTFTAPVVVLAGETLTFELTVTDNSGETDTDMVDVAVAWVNDAPTADAGPDQAADGGGNVTLDGSGSSDPDDGIASYAWVQTSGTTVTLSDASVVKPTFSAPENMAGVTLVFELTVTDNGGLTDTDTVQIIGNNSPDKPAESRSPADLAVDVSLMPELQGGPYNDADGDPHTMTWWQIATDGTDIASFEDSLIYNEKTDTYLESIIVPPNLVLDVQTKYYWRVRYFDGQSWSDSDIYSFTTTSTGAQYGIVDGVDKGVRVEDQITDSKCELGDKFCTNGNAINTATKKAFTSKVTKSVQIGIETSDGVIKKCGAINPKDFKGRVPRVPHMPYGLIELALTDVPVGGTATVTLYFTKKLPNAKNFVWWKYDPNRGEFYDYGLAAADAGVADAVVVSADRMSVTLKFMDGGYGDLIDNPDGMIIDPSGPGDEGGGSSGGTCFIDTMTR